MRWAPYVPVAKRRENAAKKMAKLAKKGQNIQPIEIQGRTIARSFWGKGWCEHMEAFCDFDNRLPRGRTYVRNGSVCHLEIKEGEVHAIVSGSSLYQVTIGIKPLLREKWEHIKKTCLGKVSSLLDLLSGKLSNGVMEVVVHPKEGLFPLTQELTLQCNCPDWATMCKHVAAVLYGVGSRLDADPAQLFKLRGVNFEELIDVEQAITSVISTTTPSRRKRMNDEAFTNLFALDSTEEVITPKTLPKKNPTPSSKFPKKLTGEAILQKRIELQCTKKAFAERAGVSVTSITLWEAKGKQLITPNAKSLEKLITLWNT
ncbi:MAG: hypothetical protein CK426_09080 [Legionella sp.]|nr:MAG: hypothetical protein CK423_10190 [Legionella sp.]PJD96159.1 MAG: hypothetical protein CK426_09080 [Legionella sp.]